LSADADLVYRTLAGYGVLDVATLGRELGLPVSRVSSAIDELAVIPAVRPLRSSGGERTGTRRWRAEAAADVVLRLRRGRLRVADDRTDAQPDSAHEVLAVLGVDSRDVDWDTVRRHATRAAVRARVAALVDAETTEHRAINPEPTFDAESVRHAAPQDRALLERGVRLRILGLPPADGDAAAQHGSAIVRLGAEARVTDSLDMKFMIFDRKIALVPLAGRDFVKGALEISQTEVVNRLLEVFDRTWATADEAGDTWPLRFDAREEALISLLAGGHTDESAARRLGISPRTVSYTLRNLMDRLGVQNRFQLGLALGALQADRSFRPSPLCPESGVGGGAS
jgi:DNA-binding CsgD family transcriptional regulator